MKLAEALLLRKQLEAKVKRLEPIRTQAQNGMLETKVTRRPVNENIDEVTVTQPKFSIEDFNKEYDQAATQLRKLDTAIQKANWQYDVDFIEEQEPKAKTETSKD